MSVPVSVDVDIASTGLEETHRLARLSRLRLHEPGTDPEILLQTLPSLDEILAVGRAADPNRLESVDPHELVSALYALCLQKRVGFAVKLSRTEFTNMLRLLHAILCHSPPGDLQTLDVHQLLLVAYALARLQQRGIFSLVLPHLREALVSKTDEVSSTELAKLAWMLPVSSAHEDPLLLDIAGIAAKRRIGPEYMVQIAVSLVESRYRRMFYGSSLQDASVALLDRRLSETLDALLPPLDTDVAEVGMNGKEACLLAAYFSHSAALANTVAPYASRLVALALRHKSELSYCSVVDLQRFASKHVEYLLPGDWDDIEEAFKPIASRVKIALMQAANRAPTLSQPRRESTPASTATDVRAKPGASRVSSDCGSRGAVAAAATDASTSIATCDSTNIAVTRAAGGVIVDVNTRGESIANTVIAVPSDSETSGTSGTDAFVEIGTTTMARRHQWPFWKAADKAQYRRAMEGLDVEYLGESATVCLLDDIGIGFVDVHAAAVAFEAIAAARALPWLDAHSVPTRNQTFAHVRWDLLNSTGASHVGDKVFRSGQTVSDQWGRYLFSVRTRGKDRGSDAEIIALRFVIAAAERLRGSIIEGCVDLVVDNQPCLSCVGAMAQFRGMLPMVTLRCSFQEPSAAVRGPVYSLAKVPDATIGQAFSLETALKTLDGMLESGFLPDSGTCFLLVQRALEEGKAQAAFEVVGLLRGHGVKLTIETYKELVSCGGLSEAQVVATMQHLQAQGLHPTQAILDAVLAACTGDGHPESATARP